MHDECVSAYREEPSLHPLSRTAMQERIGIIRVAREFACRPAIGRWRSFARRACHLQLCLNPARRTQCCLLMGWVSIHPPSRTRFAHGTLSWGVRVGSCFSRTARATLRGHAMETGVRKQCARLFRPRCEARHRRVPQ